MGTVKVDELSPDEYHEKLLGSVKAQVKAIMEESVTKKFVHEESEHVLRLCTTIHTCLLDHLRKRTAGFLRPNKIANLFTKIGKSLPEVAQLVLKIEAAESAIENQLSHEGKGQNHARPQTLQLRHFRQIWVRLALTEKKLDKILEFLVENSSKFYEKGSILSDPVRGKILSSLLVGPCALEYTKMKTSDHYWSDPPADELLQRHKLHCRNEVQSPGQRPKLQSTSKYTSADPSEKAMVNGNSANTFREYVESLHQNSKSTLLYGKNNVVVQPREELNPIHGYLSLHQVLDSLFIKWTPNQLMNVNEEKKKVNCNHDNEMQDKDIPENETPRPALVPNGDVKNSSVKHSSLFIRHHKPSEKPKTLSSYWEYAISVNVQDVVYLHCHQRNDARGTLVLVGQDGVQRPPICFPPGGHLLAFLTCLETGLLPHGHLDPPLWSQHGKGKVFPKLRKRSSHSSSSSSGSQSEVEEPSDFVFRVTSGKSKVKHSTGSSNPSAAVVSTFPPTLPIPSIQRDVTLPRIDSVSNHISMNNTNTKGSISRTVVIKTGIATPIRYDKKLLYESLITPPPKFPHLLPLFLSHGGFRVDKIHSSATLPHNGPIKARQRIEIEPVHENFDAYAIGPGYSCYQAPNPSYSSRSSLKVLCDTMRRQIISRAFYGWLAHCRHLSTVRTHLSALVIPDSCQIPQEQVSPIDKSAWDSLLEDGKVKDTDAFMKRVYFGGIDHSMRIIIWPYLLNHYPMNSTDQEKEKIDADANLDYEKVVSEWRIAEKIVKRKEKENLIAKLSNDSRTSSTSSLDGASKQFIPILRKQSTMSDVFASLEQDPTGNTTEGTPAIMHGVSQEFLNEKAPTNLHEIVMKKRRGMKERYKADLNSIEAKFASDHTPYSSISTEPSMVDRRFSNATIASSSFETGAISMDEESKLGDIMECEQEFEQTKNEVESSESDADSRSSNRKMQNLKKQDGIDVGNGLDQGTSQDLDDADQPSSNQESPVSNFTAELLDSFSLNLHRIEKDVHRCDRNHEYFTNAENLEKLQNIMCSYVWRNLDMGYMQGMCDLAAPLLLVMDDESKVFSCFTQLMKRMESNFLNGGAMDSHFANMRSLIQVLDSEMFEHMHRKGDYTHFYFCYRWFLLDFKRELSYENDVFNVWETIWAARHVCSQQFVLFFALALLHNYRDIILDNEMDFTDIVKFFNEMAERHNASKILKLAQNFVYEVQSMILK